VTGYPFFLEIDIYLIVIMKMKKLVLLISLISFTVVLFSQEDDREKALEFENKADTLYRKSQFDSAAYFFTKAANKWEITKNWVSMVKNLRLAAESYNAVSKMDSALQRIKKATNIIESKFTTNSKEENSERIEVLFRFGIIYSTFGKSKEALEYLTNAYSSALKIDSINSLRTAKIQSWLGHTFSTLSQFDTALVLLTNSLKVKEHIFGHKSAETARSLGDLGKIYRKMGDYRKSIEYFKEVIDIKVKVLKLDEPLLCYDYLNLGSSYNMIGDYDNALLSLRKALQSSQKYYDNKHFVVAAILNDFGIAHYRKGEYDKALEYYEKSAQIKSELFGKNHIRLAKVYQNIGLVYYETGDLVNAMKYQKQSLDIKIKNLGDEHPEVAFVYLNLGLIYVAQKNYNEALNYHQKALKITIPKLGKNHLSVAYSYGFIGSINHEKKNYDEALKYYQKELTIDTITFGKYHPDIARVYENIGSIYKSKGDYHNSLRYYQNSLIANLPDFQDTCVYSNPTNLNPLNERQLLSTLNHKARTFCQLYLENNKKEENILASIENHNIIYKLVQKMRSNYNHEKTKMLLSQTTKSYFSDALLAAYKLLNLDNKYSKDKAFQYLEKSKNTTLVTYLNDMQIKSYWNIADSLLNIEKHISENRRSLETNIQKIKAQKNGYDTLKVEKFQNELFGYSRQYDSLMTTLQNQYPDYYQLKYQQNVAGVDEIQQQLDSKTTLLNYFVADTTLFIAALTKDSLVYKMVKTDSLFNQLLTDYHIDIEFDFTKDELHASKKLYSYLIAPVEGLIEGKNKLVILPDEKLYYVPFETLCKKGEDINQPDYLVKNYAINYHHSATLWLNSKTKERKSVASNSFIGFAPVFDPLVNNGTILSNEWMADTTQTDVATRSVSADFNHFNALPNSEKEIKSILKLFKKKDGKAEGYLHKVATEENFKNKVSDYKYVHIASHSFTNDKYPALSGIAFSQPDTTLRNENDDDGILYAGESYNLNLSNADLVVLSSCKSGLGKLIKGEGFLSLSRGFIYSGAPNIVYSLWSVKDEPTKDLMVHFYKQLLNGKTYADALREAKLKILSNPKTAQPKYWAAWVLLGK
jgi:CHAT domain-containing protein/Tfp pilus assembly protein PilF